MFRLILYLCMVCLLLPVSLLATSASVVYNLRIATTTRRQVQAQLNFQQIVTTTFFEQERFRFDGSHQTVGGGLITLIETPRNLFLRAETAVGHIVERLKSYKASRTQLDDILFTVGSRTPWNDRVTTTCSGLLGLPTHGDDALNTPQFGFAHVALGAQIDTAYVYSTNKQHSLFAAARFIRFLPRHVEFKALVSCIPFDYSIGNVFDILVAHNSTFGRHQAEIGYNATFAFGASLYPPPSVDLGLRPTLIRSSFYASYRCGFLAKNYAQGIGLAFSYGADHIQNIFSFKRMYALWITWGIAF